SYLEAQRAGGLNVVVAGWNDSTAHVRSVTDTNGNSYRLAVGPTVQTGFATQAIYYAADIVPAAADGNTVVVTFDAPAVYPDIRIAEYRGIDIVSPVDAAAAAMGNSAMSDSGSVTTTNANDLLLAANLVQTPVTAAG